MKLAIPFLAAAAVLITTSWSNATLRPLTDSEATDVLGGASGCGFCQPDPAGQGCNMADITYCGTGTQYCRQGTPVGDPCWMLLDFKQPNQCQLSSFGFKECDDEGNLSQNVVVCLVSTQCRCNIVGTGIRVCDPGTNPYDVDNDLVFKCEVGNDCD